MTLLAINEDHRSKTRKSFKWQFIYGQNKIVSSLSFLMKKKGTTVDHHADVNLHSPIVIKVRFFAGATAKGVDCPLQAGARRSGAVLTGV